MNLENIMNTFNQDVSSLLWDYKNKILKKHLKNSNERAVKLNELDLHGKTLEQNDDLTLYHKMQNVITDIENWINRDIQSATWYSGMEEFLQHSKKVIAAYQVENNKIVHTTQKASHAIIMAIQLLPLPEDKLTEQKVSQLNNYALTIAKYGSSEQHRVFINALKTHVQRLPLVFTPILDRFCQYQSEWDES